MEGVDLAGVVDSDFQGIQINFAPPRPAGFANFRGAGRGGAALFPGGGAGWGGAHIPALCPDLARWETSNNNLVSLYKEQAGQHSYRAAPC